jgi:hypothetical protein
VEFPALLHFAEKTQKGPFLFLCARSKRVLEDEARASKPKVDERKPQVFLTPFLSNECVSA